MLLGDLVVACSQGHSQEFAKEGAKEGIWGRKSPSRVQGQCPGGGGQKPETHAEYSTEQSHRSSQIAYCSESDYTLKKFPATSEDMHPCLP